MGNLLPWADVFYLNGNNLKHFLCVSRLLPSTHTAFHLSVHYVPASSIKDLRADINYVAREVVLLSISWAPYVSISFENNSSHYCFHHSSPYRLVALMGFPGSGIISQIPENDCLSQPQSELHTISSSVCLALSEISCTVFSIQREIICSERINMFFSLKDFWLQYTEEDWKVGAAIALCPPETVSNCGTRVGAVAVSNIPAVVQERTSLGQEKSRTNSDVSQVWGVQQQQKHRYQVEETTWCSTTGRHRLMKNCSLPDQCTKYSSRVLFCSHKQPVWIVGSSRSAWMTETKSYYKAFHLLFN